MFEAAVTSKGQITFPADIRKALNLAACVRVLFTHLNNGTTVIRVKRRSMLELEGIRKPARSKRMVSIDDMNIGRR
ncbi:MAG: AbrB/MazE/SpoVT family DNA-binding domain-containing protein [Burkholderiales bacterium]